MSKLEPAGFAVGIAVVAEGAAAMAEGSAERRFDRAIQAA